MAVEGFHWIKYLFKLRRWRPPQLFNSQTIFWLIAKLFLEIGFEEWCISNDFKRLLVEVIIFIFVNTKHD